LIFGIVGRTKTAGICKNKEAEDESESLPFGSETVRDLSYQFLTAKAHN
jgi:hypothetical protein